MSVSGLGTARKSARLPILALASGLMLLGALALFALELQKFAGTRDLLQTDITVAGVPVTGLKLQEAALAWEQVYQQPVELDYQGSPILLKPSDIGFRIDSELMISDNRSKRSGDT